MSRALQQRDQGQGGGDFLALLEASKPEIAKVLPEHVKVERVIRMARTAYQMNADLRECEPKSILASVMKAAELGLEPGGGLKHCWLIPYRDHKRGVKECTFQISYFGMLELARRSGEFRSIEARVVYEKDVFDLAYDPRPRLTHKPNLFDGGAEVGAYAYAILTNGETVLEWANRQEIEKIRSSSKAGPIWNQWWGQQACKTMIKRLLKRQPLSVQLAKAIEEDHEAERIEVAASASKPIPAHVAIESLKDSRSAALARRLGGPAGEAEIVEEEASAEDDGGEVIEGREPGEDDE